MAPWWHFILSFVAAALLALFLPHEANSAITLIIAGSIVGTLVDLDHLIYAYFRKRKEMLKTIRRTLTNPRVLVEEFRSPKKGALYFSTWTKLIVHAITMFFIFVLTQHLFSSYSLMMAWVLTVHYACDVIDSYFFYF